MTISPTQRDPQTPHEAGQASDASRAADPAGVRGEPVESPAATVRAAPAPQRADDELGEPPAAAFESLHPYARWGMRLGTLLMLAGPTLVPAAVLLANWDGPSGTLRFGLWLAAFAAVLAAAWGLGGLRYARTGFALDAAGLRIRRGLWWRSETLVPRSRVQHTDINHGPLDRRLGLATLRVYTAGTRLASVALEGLPEARALQLRDALVAADPDVV